MGCGAPQPDRIIGGAADQHAAIGGESHAANHVGMAAQRDQFLAVGDISQPRQSLTSSGGQPFAVWRKGPRHAQLRVAAQRDDLAARRHIPEIDCLIGAACRQSLSIRRDGDRLTIAWQITLDQLAHPLDVRHLPDLRGPRRLTGVCQPAIDPRLLAGNARLPD